MSVYYDSGQDKTDHYGGGRPSYGNDVVDLGMPHQVKPQPGRGHRTASNNLGASDPNRAAQNINNQIRQMAMRVKMPQPKINVRKGKPNVNFKWMA